jgi:hypothetical protein
MFKKIQFLIGLTAFVAVFGLSSLPNATAQVSQQDQGQVSTAHSTFLAQRSTQSDFQGRGIAQGAAFTKGRSADVSLIVDGDNFGLEISEPLRPRGSDLGNRARVQYRGAIIRQRDADSGNSGSFTLDGRVRSFNSSDNLRVLPNTTGTCRIEVFDSRVISSTCNSVASDSSTRFLGLEQF